MASEELLKSLNSKVDRLLEGQAKHSAVLDEHQRRSLANEEAVELLRSEIKPLTVHVAMVGALGKLLAVVSTVVGVAVGLMKLLGH